jgi:kinesin family protein 11
MEVDRKLRMTGIYQKLSLSQDDICNLNRIASERSNNLQTETTKLHDFTSSMKEQ